ncbi:CPBP family intramembrane glutamic endopeptidase [Parapedobacter deserti]|uniref:CPBP family intramembrane glutamic endopeptidase n=1 Tax=Parapedobacter deserti TaxID=1912957 RepID=A0ABV7JL87_9SPHI
MRKVVRHFIEDFQKFLRNPQEIVDGPQNGAFHSWMVVLTINFAFAALVIIPLALLIDQHVLPLKGGPLPAKMPLWFLVIVILVMVPVVEELLFRYPLKFARNRVLKIAVYGSSVLFALVHMSNYDNHEVLFYLFAPVIVGSQLVGGFLMAYLRLKHGLRWSILMHAVFNAVIIVPVTLSIHGATVIDSHSPQYSLVVTQYAFSEQPEHIRIFRQEAGIDTVHVRQANLQRIVDLIGTPGAWYVDDALVDIDFKATSPIPPDSLISLLGQQFRMIPQTIPNVLPSEPRQ